MAIALRVGWRSKATGRRPNQAGPSVREVCLLGVPRPLAAGERLTWSGRAYRVEATHAGYAHLAAVSETTAGRG